MMAKTRYSLMSIPLPSTYHLFQDGNGHEINNEQSHNKDKYNNKKYDNHHGGNVEIHKVNVNDLYLDAEERFEIFSVKAAERPHLLHYDPLQELSRKRTEHLCIHDEMSPVEGAVEEKKNELLDKQEQEDNDINIPPLIDGCDLPGWRKDNIVTYNKYECNGRNHLVTINSDVQSLLNIGPSSTMFRRESQWPNINKLLELSNRSWKEFRTRLLQEPANSAITVQYDNCSQLVELDKKMMGGHQSNYGRIVTKFALEFEQKNIPAKILGATKDWYCMAEGNQKSDERLWTVENLVKRYGHVYWRFSDTHGEMMSLKTYAKYICNPEGMLDDSPLGIYDSEFGDEDSPTHEMIHEYQVPKCFSPDLFDLADTKVNITKEADVSSVDSDDEGIESTSIDDSRPPKRWILIGPERSGTGLHVDPLWTNAWVTVVQGKKRWLLFPPETPHEKIGMIENEPQINSAAWFHSYYSKVTSNEWPVEYKPVEVLQLPGETVFVPNGWPHIVLNLETTLAVTHNYASEFGPFERMWEEVVQDEPDFAKRWLCGMKSERPDLYHRAKEISLKK